MKYLIILLSLTLIACEDNKEHPPLDEYLIEVQFIDNMDGCTPEVITVEINGEIGPDIIMADNPEYTFRINEVGDYTIYYDIQDSVCGDSTLHFPLTATDQPRVVPFYY